MSDKFYTLGKIDIMKYGVNAAFVYGEFIELFQQESQAGRSVEIKGYECIPANTDYLLEQLPWLTESDVTQALERLYRVRMIKLIKKGAYLAYWTMC